LILYLALIAMVCVLGRSFETVRRQNPPPPVLENPLTSTPFRDPEARKRAISIQLEDILRTGGYYDAEIGISGSTLQIYTRDVPPELIARDIMRHRTIVETLQKLDIRFLEQRQSKSMIIPSRYPGIRRGDPEKIYIQTKPIDAVLYENNWKSGF
jgi:hypothetical protein